MSMSSMNGRALASVLVTSSLSLGGLGLLLVCTEAAAALGKAPSTLFASPMSAAPTARMLAATSGTQVIGYTQHAVLLESGTTVQEYATPAGVVFAVVWRGPVLPDLSALLGDYFNGFKAQTEQDRAIGKRGSPVNLLSDKLVVRSSGRMRSFSGYAYAPDLMPAGLDIKNVLQ